MKIAYSKSILASYATFKELYKSNDYKSPFQILSEFLRYIIVERSLFSFSATEIQGYLKDDFGFNPPIAVVRTALRSLNGLRCDQQVYIIQNKDEINSSVFQAAQNKSESYHRDLVDAVIRFSQSRGIAIDKDKVEKELFAFVLDDDGDREYQQLISEFVLYNKNNSGITDAISAIQEGGILYTGLTYNISELGSITKPITLFLDTEILFDIIGLNGELYKTLANDFIQLVNTANRGGKVLITLRYFPEVATDIDHYYGMAERVVEGKGEVVLNHAMKAIIKGCKDVSNVAEKRTDMYRKLHIEYGIREFEGIDFYSASNIEYNLEENELPGFPASEQANYEAIRFCSHINVLRKGEKTQDIFASKYLCVTGTRRVLDVSRVLTDINRNSLNGERICGYATSLNYITNLLWYKLNSGFGSTAFPHNLDAVIKARIILSGFISQEITTTYNELKKKSQSGELSRDRVAAYIVALKEKSTLPETLDSDNIEDILDFSEDYFNRFAETISQNTRLIKERDDTIKELSSDVEDLKEKLSKANNDNIQKQQQIDMLAQKIKAIEDKEADIERHKATVKSRWLLTWAIVWKILAIIIVVSAIKFVCNYAKADFGTWLSIAIGVLGVSGGAISIVKHDLKKHKEQCLLKDNNSDT